MVNNTETQLEEYDPQVLLELQAAFGMLVVSNPALTKLVNNTAPVLFATLLFSAAQEYRETEDGEGVEPTRGVLEALESAITHLQSVATAFGRLDGSITVEPSEGEIDQDTDLHPVV